MTGVYGRVVAISLSLVLCFINSAMHLASLAPEQSYVDCHARLSDSSNGCPTCPDHIIVIIAREAGQKRLRC